MNARQPVVAILGHIDHGKSELLNYIRGKTKKEAGDITQHIGAYDVMFEYENKEKTITMIDTPGHAAFTHVREKGILFCDIALLVISLEEGIRGLTKDAYEAIKKRDIPVIVVYTKCDLAKDRLGEVKNETLKAGILLETLGGNIPFVCVSSKTGENIDELLDVIQLTSDLNPPMRKSVADGIGVLIEVDIDDKSGIAGTIILTDGTLEPGKYITIGNSYCPVRAIKNSHNESIVSTFIPQPVRITGFDKVPSIGERVFVFDDRREAKKYAESNKGAHTPNINSRLANENLKFGNFSIVLKADTLGSLNSILKYIDDISTKDFKINLIKTGIGKITEEDINLSKISNAFVVGFHTGLDKNVKVLRGQMKDVIKEFETIYEFIVWIEKELEHFVLEKSKEFSIGKGKIIKLFKLDGPTKIIGTEILEGKFKLDQRVSINREDKEVGIYTLKKIQQKNKDVEHVSDRKTQFACELIPEKDTNQEIKEGDTLLGLYTE